MGIGNYGTTRTPKTSQAAASQQAAQVEEEVIVKTQPKAPPTPARTLAESVERGMEQDVREGEGVATKALSYEEMLKLVGVTPEQARVICDSLLVDGYYSETVNLSQSTSVTFSTREGRDLTYYYHALTREQPQYESHRGHLMVRYFLVASLRQYREKHFPRLTDLDEVAYHEEFTARLKWLDTLPPHVVTLLQARLAAFDEKIEVVLSEGAVEAF